MFFSFRHLFSVNYCILYTLLILLTGATSCSTNDYHKCGGIVWNTVYNVTYEGAPELQDSIMPTLDRIARSASAFDSLSLISRINRNETDIVDEVVRRLLEASIKVNDESDKKFDPTVGPLIQAWGFGKGHTPSADTANISSMLEYVGIDKCRVDQGRLVKPDPRMQFNFSAIAKGMGCDAIAEMMERNGVVSYLIEIGGEIRASGVSPRGDGWAVSVDAPIESADTVVHESMLIINLNKGYINGTCGVATSGNYRNFHRDGAKTFGHTIDPQTGRPAVTDVVSATVITSDAMMADAYATAIMAMGSTAAINMCQRLSGVEAYIVTANGRTWMTPGFKQLINK